MITAKLIPTILYNELSDKGLINEESFNLERLTRVTARNDRINPILETVNSEDRSSLKQFFENIYNAKSMDWNENYEFIDNDKILEGSNIIDLTITLLRRPVARVPHVREFYETLKREDLLNYDESQNEDLSHLGTPHRWISFENLGHLINNDGTTE